MKLSASYNVDCGVINCGVIKGTTSPSLNEFIPGTKLTKIDWILLRRRCFFVDMNVIAMIFYIQSVEKLKVGWRG